MAKGYRSFTRISLLILNCLLLLLAVGMLAISAVLYQSGDMVSNNYVVPLLEKLEVSYQITVATVITKITIAFIVVGAILLLTSAVGFFGALFRLMPLLILYGVLVILTCGFHIFVIYLWFRMRDQVISSSAKAKLKANLMFYDGSGGKTITKAWNYMFLWLDCCGIDPQSDVDDFETSAWNRTTRGTNRIPAYCCKDATSETASTYLGKSCTVSPTEENAWISKGCYAALSDYIRQYSDGFLAIAFLVLFIGILAVIFALVYAYMISTKSKGRLDKRSISEEALTCQADCAPCDIHDPPCIHNQDWWCPRYTIRDPCTHSSHCHKPDNYRKMKVTSCRKHMPRVCCHGRLQRIPQCQTHKTCHSIRRRPNRCLPRTCDHFTDPPYWIPYDRMVYPPYDWEYWKKKKDRGYYTDPYGPQDYYAEDTRDIPMLTWRSKQ